MNTPTITDEQIAEIIDFSDSDCAADWEEVRGLKVGPLRALIYRLRAAERDAARYRALRDQSRRPIVVRDQHSHLFGDLLDSRIDATMNQPKPNNPA